MEREIKRSKNSITIPTNEIINNVLWRKIDRVCFMRVSKNIMREYRSIVIINNKELHQPKMMRDIFMNVE